MGDRSVHYNKIQFSASRYNSSRGVLYASGTGGSSTIILVTVSLGFVDDNVSISGRDKVFADPARLVTEAELPRVVSG
jgi:hypothetical protein